MDTAIEKYIEIASFLGNSLDSTHEIILFDTTQRNYPMIAHSKRTNETVNCTRQLLASALKNETVKARGLLLNRAVPYDFGKLLKSSIYLIKDANGAVVGALCVNLQCSAYFQMQLLASSALSFDSDDLDDAGNTAADEDFPPAEPTLDTITQVINEFGVEPGRHSPEERLELMCDLYDLGVFELKGSVARVAEALNMSDKSVYRYLTKIKKLRG